MKKTVLLCDDDEGTLEVSKIILEKSGYKVRLAESCDNTYESIINIKPDIVFLDIRMPGEGGGKIAKRLKRNKETKKIPLIIMSAHENLEKITKEVGADDFLAKPFDIKELSDIVKKHIGK
jgi:DNA-binding response OmpR family regulator